MNPIRRLIPCWPALLVIGLPFFFVGGPGFFSPRSFARAWDLGHILYFGLFTLWLTTLRPARDERLPPAPRLVLLLAPPFLAGCLIEWLQFRFTGRSPDWGDMLRNLLGSALVVCFLKWPRLREKGRRMLALGRGLVLLCLLAALCPTAAALLDECRARQDFPVLAGFESPLELSRWYYAGQLRPERRIVRRGNRSARVQLSTAKYSGITLLHFPRDWRGYKRLCFSVYNPLAAPLELHCRLDDARHRKRRGPYTDRYNTRFALKPGWNDLAVSLEEAAAAPRGRTMDMGHVIGFGLFVVEQKEAIAIYLDNVYLKEE